MLIKFSVYVEYKTPWAADLKDLPVVFSKSDRTLTEQQSIEALEQLNCYMSFNNTKYGVLTNWTRAWFLRRMDTGDRKTLEYAGPIELDSSAQSPSMLKALVGMVLLAENDRFYVSPTLYPHRFFGSTERGRKGQKRAIGISGNYNVLPENGTYPCLDLDFRLCDFRLSTAYHSGVTCTVCTNFLQGSLNKTPLGLMCKVVDILRQGNNMLEPEVRAYAALEHLQGDAIPRLYGYYNVWGILDLLALEPVGDAVREDETITPALREQMKSTLGRIHSAGYLHGDVARRKFCIKNSKMFMIDLEMSRPSNDESQCDEKRLVDFL